MTRPVRANEPPPIVAHHAAPPPPSLPWIWIGRDAPPPMPVGVAVKRRRKRKSAAMKHYHVAQQPMAAEAREPEVGMTAGEVGELLRCTA